MVLYTSAERSAEETKSIRSLKTKQETSISKEIKRTRKTKNHNVGKTFWAKSNGEFDPGSG